ncbi:MAG TPA: hypothetical protein VE890_04775 [Thermoguttaceae bacterium]|nr:hypothetical protein [Thermoguttaceae bacterium]
MTRTASKHHRSRRQADAGVSLFPFLAVLICTMGALIVLLVVLARQARLQAAQASSAAVAESADEQQERQIALEDVQWRIEQLNYSRDATEAQLAESRLRLGHIEDHARRLREQLAQLQAAYNELQTFDQQESQQQTQIRSELSQLEGQIAEARAAVADAEHAAAQRQRSFAIIPYKGPYETHRRPIYIECRADAVVLQPEGIELSEEDFIGPMGPGNPLAAALRSAREYLLVHDGIDPQQTPDDPDSAGGSNEPYPLLLVRPEGIMAYYVAREAMSSWASDFGYELIGDDWKLDFQDPDPQLAQVEAKAVHSARVRQARLVAAAPSHYGGGGGSRPEYRAAPGRGGAILDGGSSDAEDRGYQSRRPNGSLGSNFGQGGFGGSGSGDSGFGDSEAEGSGALPADAAGMSGSPFAGHVAPGGSGDASASDGTMGSDSPGGSATWAPSSEGIAGRPPREQSDDTTGQQGAPVRPGEWRPPVDDTTSGSPRDLPGGSPRQKVNPLAETRGENWGLPGAADRSVGIKRPIRLDCYADRLVIVAPGDPYGKRTIPLSPNTEDSVDDLISAIWNHMDSWGIAGNGMYWQPELRLYVDPNASDRYDQLQTLLDGSGLTVVRKEAF